MKTIKQTYTIASSLAKVWDALTNPKTISAWGGGPAKMSDKKDFTFSLWGGSIYGKNTEVIKNKKLVQDWFSNNEITDKPSQVAFILKEQGEKVILTLLHKNIPDEVVEDIANGWQDYYLGEIKKYLEAH